MNTNNKTITITKAAEEIANAFLVPLDTCKPTFEDVEHVRDMLLQTSYANIMIESFKTGAKFNLIATKGYISFSEQFSSPDLAKTALKVALIPEIIKHLEEQIAQETKIPSLEPSPLE